MSDVSYPSRLTAHTGAEALYQDRRGAASALYSIRDRRDSIRDSRELVPICHVESTARQYDPLVLTPKSGSFVLRIFSVSRLVARPGGTDAQVEVSQQHIRIQTASGRGRHDGGKGLSQGRDIGPDLLPVAVEVRLPDAVRNEVAEAAGLGQRAAEEAGRRSVPGQGDGAGRHQAKALRPDRKRQLRILTIVDAATRLCPAIDVRVTYRSADVVETLERVTAVDGWPKRIRTDQSTGFTYKGMDLWAW